MNAIEPESRFVHRARPERVRFAQREDLALPSASIAEPGNCLSVLRGRFRTAVSLIGIIAVHRVGTAKPMIDVQRVLIISNRRNARPPKRAWTAVRDRYQRQQLSDRGICNGCSLSVRQNAAVQRQCLAMLESLIAEKEKRSIPHNGPAKSAAVLIAAEGRFGDIEKVPCVEDVVAQIVEDFAVELVGAGLRRDIHDRSRITSVFGAECRIRDLELVDSIYRWLKCDLLV